MALRGHPAGPQAWLLGWGVGVGRWWQLGAGWGEVWGTGPADPISLGRCSWPRRMTHRGCRPRQGPQKRRARYGCGRASSCCCHVCGSSWGRGRPVVPGAGGWDTLLPLLPPRPLILMSPCGDPNLPSRRGPQTLRGHRLQPAARAASHQPYPLTPQLQPPGGRSPAWT